MAQPKPAYPTPQAIHHEQRNAENSAAYLLPKLHAMRGHNPALNVLDVGAGSGTISVSLAKLLPDGHIMATDLNPDILPRARAIAELSGVSNITFEQADVYKLPFPDAAFDITHCHQVLAHLKEPWNALREMIRVTKPAGIIAAREGDYETECTWPELSGTRKFHDFIVGMMKLAGGSPTAGRQLLSWALRAGAERDQVTATFGALTYSAAEDKKVWAQVMVERVREGRMRKSGLEAGLVTEDDLEEMAKAWEEWETRDDAFMGMLNGEILVQKR